jgi:parallel beta-helix repeat protein
VWLKFVPKAIRKWQCFIIIRNPADCIERVYGEEKIMSRFRAGLVSGVYVLLLFVAVFVLVLNVPVVGADGTIYIRADGSIDPPTAPISTLDNITYTFTGNIYEPIVIERSNIIIDGKGYTLQGVEAAYGFWSVSENNVTIKNTNIKGFYESGIYFIVGSYLTIYGNNITNNGEFGIEMWCSSSFNIFGNNLTANRAQWMGANIFMAGSPYGASSSGNITENYISGSWNGISLYGSSNMIYRNNIVANEVGISIGDSYNAIFGNNITSNNVGIYIYCDYDSHSSNNKIYHNNFVNNTSQVSRYSYINIETNLWDDDYPSGGNFWSDHVGVDLNRGPFQNETGGDGIGDAPHIVDEYIKDRYPLVSPWPSGPLLHELKVDLNSPLVWPVNRSVLLEATVFNSEINSETNVAFYLYINGSIVNSTSISLLGASASYTINYLWTPVMEGVYNVTAYAAPVPAEIYIANNRESEVAIIRHPIIMKVPYDYATIQGAINALSQPSMPEDTIQVSAGTYYENIVVNKTLSLIGEGSDRTIIDGNNTGTAVAIKADSVLITNFTIQNASGSGGIYLESVRNCYITRNKIKINSDGIHLQYSSNNIISENNITANSWYGLDLGYSSENVISRNELKANAYGLLFIDSGLNIISENNITLNNWWGAALYGSYNNRVYHDNFINNTYQVITDSANIWDDGYPSGGNYWSDYTGVDEKSGPNQDQPGRDGIGDTPYPIGDRYPLINPWAAPFPVAKFTYTPYYPFINEIVTFNAWASYDSDGIVETYTWDFGDGNTTSVTTPTITHTYTTRGIYPVNLTVTDNDGLSRSIIKSVKVREKGEPLTVDYDGPADFRSIQEAVNAANIEDIIYVYSGTYDENIFLNKTGLTVIGENPSTTVIDGGYHDGVTINASNVSISNFTIQPLWFSSASGIQLKSARNCNIAGNTITNNWWGIKVDESSNNTLSGNTITNNWYGIYLYNSSNNSIYGNKITASNWDGIRLEYSSNYNSIHENNITANNWNGIVLYESPSNTISRNNILNNKWDGITVSGFDMMSNLAVNNNTIMFSGEDGLYLSSYYYIYNVTVSSNIISSNGENGVYATAQNHYPGEIFDLEISSNIISANRQKGIWIVGNINANLTCNSISYNTYGVFYTTTINNSAHYNDIYRNSYGMNVTNGAAVNATFNYWGDPSGPYHESLNINGTGNPVNSNGVDLDFTPFLTDPVGQINERPVAMLAADETRVNIDQTVTFDASASTDDGQIEYYLFDFGDGTKSSWMTSPIITHKYFSRGTYNATLIIIDNYGVTSLDGNLTYVTITVIAPPIAHFTSSPEPALVDVLVTFNASSSYDPDGTIESYRWDFGDGNVTTVTEPIVTHIYTAQGTYTVNLTVTDNDGLTHSTTKPITAIEDSTPPTTTHDYDSLWHTSDFTITLTATDDLSGVAETYYKINDGPIQNVTADGQPSITTEGADNKLEYWSVDNAGNEELPHKILTGIKLDKTYPTVETPSRTPDGDVLPDQPVKVSVNVTDATSQVKNVTLSYTINDGETWTDLPMNHTTSNLYEATIPPQQAGTTVRFKIFAYDHAGNNRTLDGAEPYCVYQVVPEFPPILILPLFIITTLLAVMFCRRKQKPHQKTV